MHYSSILKESKIVKESKIPIWSVKYKRMRRLSQPLQNRSIYKWIILAIIFSFLLINASLLLSMDRGDEISEVTPVTHRDNYTLKSTFLNMRNKTTAISYPQMPKRNQLLVGVLSAVNYFERRNNVRKTWWKYLFALLTKS